MRPLPVRTVCSSGPLFCRGWPVVGCRGGGESRLRGFESELECGLVGGQTEVGEEVADLLLAGVDDLAGGGGVDGSGHVGAELLEVTAHLFEQILGRKLGLVVHRVHWEGAAADRRAQRRPPHILSGGYDLPEVLPHRFFLYTIIFLDTATRSPVR